MWPNGLEENEQPAAGSASCLPVFLSQVASVSCLGLISILQVLMQIQIMSSDFGPRVDARDHRAHCQVDVGTCVGFPVRV